MSTPYFSVLVAAYNVDKYLDECLTSLIQQTYLDAEFIVVDDASTDNTKQICEGFAQRDVRFKLVRNEKNEGLLAVRKKKPSKWLGDSLWFSLMAMIASLPLRP